MNQRHMDKFLPTTHMALKIKLNCLGPNTSGILLNPKHLESRLWSADGCRSSVLLVCVSAVEPRSRMTCCRARVIVVRNDSPPGPQHTFRADHLVLRLHHGMHHFGLKRLIIWKSQIFVPIECPQERITKKSLLEWSFIMNKLHA